MQDKISSCHMTQDKIAPVVPRLPSLTASDAVVHRFLENAQAGRVRSPLLGHRPLQVRLAVSNRRHYGAVGGTKDIHLFSCAGVYTNVALSVQQDGVKGHSGQQKTRPGETWMSSKGEKSYLCLGIRCFRKKPSDGQLETAET